MDYGKHCHECGRLDFLPLECRKCGQVFCGNHREHKCVPLTIRSAKSSEAALPIVRSSKTAEKSPLNERAFSKPTSNLASKTIADRPAQKPSAQKPSAQKPAQKSSAVSSGNKPQRLGGGGGQVGSERALAALQRLKGLVGSRPTRINKSGKGPNLEQRRQAIGDTRIPQADRIYLEIERLPIEVANTLTNDKTLRPSKTIWMFFDKSLNAGQILDRAAKQLGVVNGVLEAEGRLIDVHSLATDFEGTKLHLVAAK